MKMKKAEEICHQRLQHLPMRRIISFGLGLPGVRARRRHPSRRTSRTAAHPSDGVNHHQEVKQNAGAKTQQVYRAWMKMMDRVAPRSGDPTPLFGI